MPNIKDNAEKIALEIIQLSQIKPNKDAKGMIRARFCDFMQRIMNCGGCESLINDDRGYWAIASNGTQNVPMKQGPADIQTTFFIKAKDFAKTPEDALIKWAKGF